MSQHAFPRLDRFPELLGLLPVYVATPTAVASDDTTLTLTFTPDLTTAQTSSLGRLVAYCRVSLGLSAAEWMALAPQLTEIKTFRTRSLATWNGLTTTQREADEIAYLNDITDVLRAILRDG